MTNQQRSLMSESNERLARVETTLAHHGNFMDRMERHLEGISLAHQESAKAVAQIPGLMEKLISQGDRLDDHATRITSAEKDAATALDGVKSLNKLRPAITRVQLIATGGAFLACTTVAAIITAAARGWLS